MSALDAARPVREATRASLRNDLWLAAALFVAAVLSTALNSVAGIFGDDAPGPEWGLIYALALTAPLAVRRRHPGAVAVTVAVAYFVGMTARVPEVYVGNIALFVSFYTVGAWLTDRRRATIIRAGIIVGMFVWLTVNTFRVAIDPSDEALSQAGLFSPFAAYMLLQFLVNAAFFGGAYYMGDRAFAAAEQHAALQERTRDLEREREVTAAQAVALDRVHIARELHDVVAHHVSAMGVQAGAARAVLDRDPAAARTALEGVEQSARSALGELRGLLETLRTTVDTEPVDGSTLTLAALDDLVAHARDHGLPATLTIVGEPRPLSAVTEVALYRIAQEALTNARRHAGPGATADVRVRYGAENVELEITNTGRATLTPRPGLGIVGMRERAAAIGGDLTAAPRERGGFLVRAEVPTTTAVPA
ncbi:sensor histidine kinase [Microbacterium aquimaris]|uniref:sensor histidine kinase n=1 Tax=Microbacterium aquimaris TaxID=459816 RepID=UPI002AD430D2|nr:sensor histidine kinase [Microbacterium aquimaris]MDZ8275183.1 sensor histidine kinase [Microbacterium aquimaris]